MNKKIFTLCLALVLTLTTTTIDTSNSTNISDENPIDVHCFLEPPF